LTLPMLLILLTVVFLLLRVAPGDPIRATLGDRLSPEQIAERSAALGYDDPLSCSTSAISVGSSPAISATR
jgi:peptide/nickel transport system permease protein